METRGEEHLVPALKSLKQTELQNRNKTPQESVTVMAPQRTHCTGPEMEDYSTAVEARSRGKEVGGKA